MNHIKIEEKPHHNLHYLGYYLVFNLTQLFKNLIIIDVINDNLSVIYRTDKMND